MSPPPLSDAQRAQIDAVLADHRDVPGALLPVLHAVQRQLGCIPPAAVPVIARALQRSRAEVHGVVRYYAHFRETPLAGPHVQVCMAESCQACGSAAVWAAAQQHAGGAVVEPVYCLGLCAASPALQVGQTLHARVTPEAVAGLIAGAAP